MNILEAEQFLYCGRSIINVAKNYEEFRVQSKQGYFSIDLVETWSPGECELSLVFDKGIVAFFTTNESYALGRFTAIDHFRGLNDYEPWPLFEIKNSERLTLFGFKNSLIPEGLRHFFVSTDSRFTDVFSYYPPRMIVKNRADCNGKEHRDGISCPEKDNIELLIT